MSCDDSSAGGDTTRESSIPDSMQKAIDNYSEALTQGDSAKQAEATEKMEYQLLNRDSTMNAIQIKFDDVIIKLNTFIEEHGLEDKVNDPDHEIMKLQNKIARTMRNSKLSADEQKAVLSQIAELKKLVQKLEVSTKSTKWFSPLMINYSFPSCS